MVGSDRVFVCPDRLFHGVCSIVDAVCEQRTRISGRLQTVLLSATLDDRVQKLAGEDRDNWAMEDTRVARGRSSAVECMPHGQGGRRVFIINLMCSESLVLHEWL